MVSQTRDIDNGNNQIHRDFTEIENNRGLINTHLESIDRTNELRINRVNVDLSTGLLLKKVHQLISFWSPIQKVSNRKKKTQNKPCFTEALLKSIESKNKLCKKMCRTKYTLKRQELEIKVKIFKKYIL